MDRAAVVGHLAQARRHVAQGARHIARQREIIAELEFAGGDSWTARKLLDQFEDIQRLHVEDCDRLERELEHFKN